VDNTKGVQKGTWDSINVVDVKINKEAKNVTYKVTTSIILDIKITTPEAGEVTIGGTLSKKVWILNFIEKIMINFYLKF
jgi:hypothetical protein